MEKQQFQFMAAMIFAGMKAYAGAYDDRHETSRIKEAIECTKILITEIDRIYPDIVKAEENQQQGE